MTDDETVRLEVTLTAEGYEKFREMLEEAELNGEIDQISVRILS